MTENKRDVPSLDDTAGQPNKEASEDPSPSESAVKENDKQEDVHNDNNSNSSNTNTNIADKNLKGVGVTETNDTTNPTVTTTDAAVVPSDTDGKKNELSGEKRKEDQETEKEKEETKNNDTETQPVAKKAKIAMPPPVASTLLDVDEYVLDSPPPSDTNKDEERIDTPNLILFGLHPLAKEPPLKKLCANYGEVQTIMVRSAFASRYGHVAFATVEEARAAYKALNGAKLLHKTLMVQPGKE